MTEAAIFLVTTGRLAGEYVAACAQSKCRYWGKLSSSDSGYAFSNYSDPIFSIFRASVSLYGSSDPCLY